ncbi:branched-chain amino acid ABC transporter permease [Planktotalea sp.]|uniref:branched-chain amino acid ABC transporter permease n=1 Tax=Planktotalea sp. TaxID=2029877 RepID=UPI003D6BA2C4
MTLPLKNVALFAIMIGLLVFTGLNESWNSALGLINYCLISAIIALGVNLQWGYAGLFNVGVMGFVALGGLSAVLISHAPVDEAWKAGGFGVIIALLTGAATIVLAVLIVKRKPHSRLRTFAILAVLIGGFMLFRALFDPSTLAIEKVDPAATGFLGGLGLPIILSWPVGALLAAGAAWIIGKTALGLRSDYLAIATLGIAEIVIAIIKNEDWLTRGVKNVQSGMGRIVPREVDLQNDSGFVERANGLGFDAIDASTIFVKLNYTLIFTVVLVLLLIMLQLALKSPWGRMLRAIRDNEVAAEAMGKDVTARHLQVFIFGSAICGLAGAMMITLEGQLIPGTYNPLRFTFLVWVMVIVGGSGNNIGAVLGGFFIWFLWIQVEPLGHWLMGIVTAGMADSSALKHHLLESAAHMRLLTMGLVLLLVLRFSPRGLIPEK